MITKVVLVLVTVVLLVRAGDIADVYEEEIPSTHVPQLLSTSVIIVAVMGESVTLPCQVDDLGDFVLLWKTGKGQVLFALPVKVTRDERFSVANGETSLHIAGILPKDSGEYVCQLSTTPAAEVTHVLNVQYPPAVKPVPASGGVTAKEGERVSLSCEATGNPEPNITWKHAGRHYQSANNRDFVLEDVQKGDSGEYECIADNGIGDAARTTITVDVVSAPKISAHPANGLVRVNEGESVSISCEATGDPTPVITWQKHGAETMMSNGNNEKIIIEEADRSHAGTYECKATNSLGIFSSFEIKVEVLYAPEIEVPTHWIHTGEGTTVHLNCTVSGEPMPEVTWKKGERVILSSDEHYHLRTVGNTHVLVIRRMRKSDFGNYECSAQNFLSTASATIDVMGTPKAPSFTGKPHGSQSTRYTLQWMVESHSDIDEYSLRYKKKSEGEDWIVIKVEPNDEEEQLEKSQTHQLTDLEPGTTYEAVVSAHNEFGWSNESENFEFRTKHEVATPNMTKEPDMAATVVVGGMSKSNAEKVADGGNGDSASSCHVSFLVVAAQVVVLCILRPFLL